MELDFSLCLFHSESITSSFESLFVQCFNHVSPIPHTDISLIDKEICHFMWTYELACEHVCS